MEGIWGLPISMIRRGHSNGYNHHIVYLLHMDGDAQLNCIIPHALELTLGVAPHLQAEYPTSEEDTDHPRCRQSLVL